MSDKVKVEELDSPSHELLSRLFNRKVKYGLFGDVGCCQMMVYKEGADKYKNMVVRPDDLWVVTFPRSGTTWTQELVWLLKNDLDFDTAANIPLSTRYMFLELKHAAYTTAEETQKLEEILDPESLKAAFSVPVPYEAVIAAPSPRFIKSHMHLSLLPNNLLDTAKVVYVARDPRDVAVSYYHHTNMFNNFTGNFKDFWNLFINDLVVWAPFFAHLKEAWALRHHPNMLFVFYEDMIKDLPSTVKRIAVFLGKEVTDENISKLCEHLNIKNFRKNESVNPSWMSKIGKPNGEGFVRQGKSGEWRKDFDEEMIAQAQRWMQENLADTDLRFPDHTVLK